MVEKIQDITRLVIDLDLKWSEEITERQYNIEVLKDIINDIMYNVNQLYELSDEQKFCMVMEKESHLPAKQKKYKFKDGIIYCFHILFTENRHIGHFSLLLKTDYKGHLKSKVLNHHVIQWMKL